MKKGKGNGYIVNAFAALCVCNAWGVQITRYEKDARTAPGLMSYVLTKNDLCCLQLYQSHIYC